MGRPSSPRTPTLIVARIDDVSGLYHEQSPASASASRFAHAWPFSQAFSATVALASVPGLRASYRRDVQRRLAAAARYWNAQSRPQGFDSAVRPPLGRGGIQFYDDNEWMALELVRAHRILGDRAPLALGARVFAFVDSGWDRDGTHPCPGGVFWTRDPGIRDRNTVTTANGALLGAASTSRPADRSFSPRRRPCTPGSWTAWAAPTISSGTTSGSTAESRRPGGATTRAR